MERFREGVRARGHNNEHKRVQEGVRGSEREREGARGSMETLH